MSKQLSDILSIVEDLNDSTNTNGGLEYYYPFEFMSVGWTGSAVKFMGVVIWSEADDEREFNELLDEYEPFRNFFIKQANKIMKDLKLKMSNIK